MAAVTYHVLAFRRQADGKIVVECACGYVSVPVPRVTGADGSGGPSAASLAYLHMQAQR